MKLWLLVLVSAVFLAFFGAVTAALLATPEGKLVAMAGVALLVAPHLILSLQRRDDPRVN